MSSPLLCANLAPGSPVVFSRQEKPALIFERLAGLPKLAGVTSASRLDVRPTPEMVSSGLREIDTLTGGLPRGCLTEICGPASSGRTSILLAALAAATRRQEVCALVDASDAFDPLSGAAAGVDFEKMLWVRCGIEKQSPQRHRDAEKRNKKELHPKNNREGHDFSRADQPSLKRDLAPEGPLEKALRATDLLLQSGGFGMIVVDLGDVPFKSARRIPLTTWFRFQRAVETTPTILFVIAESPLAQTCASVLVKVQSSAVSRQPSGKLSAVSSQLSATPAPSHAELLEGLHVEGELLRSRLERKPARSVATAFISSARVS
jgi:hypothetical protein